MSRSLGQAESRQVAAVAGRRARSAVWWPGRPQPVLVGAVPTKSPFQVMGASWKGDRNPPGPALSQAHGSIVLEPGSQRDTGVLHSLGPWCRGSGGDGCARIGRERWGPTGPAAVWGQNAEVYAVKKGAFTGVPPGPKQLM